MPSSATVPATVVAAKTDARQLRELAGRFVRDYPDLHDLTYLAAEKIIRQHTGKTLNPDKVYWNRFDRGVTSPLTFTGWEHNDRPQQSMTFTQLVMQRFSAHDQEDPSDLPSQGGFYTDGLNHDRFNETNEVRMLPQDVLNDFWALNFSAAYAQKLQRFWADHSETFSVLAKTRYLSAAAECLRLGQLSLSDYTFVAGVLTTEPLRVPTLSELKGPPPVIPGLSVYSLSVAGAQTQDILRIVTAQGRQALYIPSDAQPFRAFAGEPELREWLQQRFASATTNLPVFDVQYAPIVGDPFVWLRDIARRKMGSDAEQLTSNGDLRKQMWLGYLSAFIDIFDDFALLSWPLALVLVGASLASTGLNIDQAINGKTPEQRRAGVLGAILDAVYLLCNLPLLVGMRRWVSATANTKTLATKAVTASVSSELSGTTSTLSESLEGVEGNLILDSLSPATSAGKFQGIYTLSNGETWIVLDQLPYRVAFSEELQSWTIVAPDNIFAFTAARPVALNAEGRWVLLERPGLRGGAPMDAAVEVQAASSAAAPAFPTISSAFWDEHMLFNLSREEWLSEQALARQKDVVEVFKLEPDEHWVSDSDGEDVHIDQWGAKHRVFKTDDDQYFGAHIQRYTHEDDAYNVFLRTGVTVSIEQQVKDIEQLAEDVATLGSDNDMDLYRGGIRDRGTSGAVFRRGQIKVGDVLVNTDVTSFSENPYQARVFASSQAGLPASATTFPITFDDTSVVFKLPAKSYLGASPIAPFSSSPDEAELIFMPGHYFQIERLEQVRGAFYRFMQVTMREVDGPLAQQGLYDMHSGKPFSRAEYAARLKPQGKVLVDRFFPLPSAD